ncbi:hypothetical protein OKA04_12265 [Luteolibacter flavescens]|uniref:Uncharacterized protein n=1 Tax=Luteolibacter flavescens TaxID=1859460 RepID=A0ABT3FRB4_9BACT|nr:hypothetical protein [Luteolibacter flavescens]MCW1885505.1 hypothetical protein [Luteolibacter flavescens]
MADDAFTPRTTVDDSQFQGIINIYTTKRAVSVQTPLPAIGAPVGPEWGQFSGHLIIARGSSPRGNNHKEVWIQHLPAPATFAAQDSYNFSKSGGDTVSRFYVMKRADYLASGYAGTIPAAGTPDTLFPPFKFATETVSKIGSDPNSILVAVERIFILSPKIEPFYDDELDASVTRTTEVVPRGSVADSSGGGVTVEGVSGSEHHDLKITTRLAGDYSAPRQLVSIPADANYPFPALLRGINLVAAWAWANSPEAAPAYDEAYYFAYDIVKPSGGPYEARILRFLTTTPDALRLLYPIQKIVTVNETIGISRAWANASDRGNSAFAEARQLDIPETIHGELHIENGDTISVGQSTNTLAATPGFSAFAGSSSMIIGYTPRKTRYGLYLIEIEEINTTGVYNGQTIPLGQTAPDGYTGDTGANDPPPAAGRPLLPTADISADNRTISGTTSPYAEVSAREGLTIIGRGMSDGSGAYSMKLDVTHNDPVVLSVIARRGGIPSQVTPVTTNDLAPLAPTATISADLTTLTGTSKPGARISILVNAVAQVETVTIPANRPQILTLAFAGTITTSDDALVDFTSALVSVTGVMVPLTAGMAAGEMATAAQWALEGTAANAHWIFSTAGGNLLATARVTAANDGTAGMNLTDPNSTGVTPATSTITTAGNSPVSITAAGTARATITSGVASWSPLQVDFAVGFGDTASTVAEKAVAGILLSQANNDYLPGSAGNQVTLTARAVAPNDASLAISITNGTCQGLIPSPASANTTPGVGASTVVANSAGNFAFAFSTALSPGDEVSVTATDAGGTSPATVVEASSTPPTLTSAAFTTSVLIEGVATPGARVNAYLGNTLLAYDTADGGGNYGIPLLPGLIRGESVRVVATSPVNAAIRSNSITITAPVIPLAMPTFTQASIGYVGTLPAGATTIAIYPENDPDDETLATVHPNGNFVFTLPSDLGENGERWAVVARYPAGDSDPVWFYAPTIDLGPLHIELLFSSSRPGGAGTPQHINFYHFVWIREMRPGMVLTLSFPGSAQADIVVNGADFLDMTIPGHTQPTWPFNVVAPVPRFGAYIPIHGTATIIPGVNGPIPLPLVTATLALPDGRIYTAAFDRGLDTNAHWNGTKWNILYELPLDAAATWTWKSTYP